MRDLTATVNVVEINDGRSGDTHRIKYRNPTPDEMAAYSACLIRRKGKSLKSNVVQTRLKYGAKIIEGFEKGTIGVDGKAIASDPNDPDYRSDWKQLFIDAAPDIVCSVAYAAFEATGVNGGLEDDPPLEE